MGGDDAETETWRVRKRRSKTDRDDSSFESWHKPLVSSLLLLHCYQAPILLLWVWVQGWGIGAVRRPHMESIAEMEVHWGTSRLMCPPCTSFQDLHPLTTLTSRFQSSRKVVCFPHHIFFFFFNSQRQASCLLWCSAWILPTQRFSLLCLDFWFWLLQNCVSLLTMGSWVSLTLFHVPNLIVERETLRARKVKWLAQGHARSCGGEAARITASP